MYNYLEEMKEEIKNYIEENIDEYACEVYDTEEIKEKLNEDLWDSDITCNNGNFVAKDIAWDLVKDNRELFIEAVREFCCPAETVAEYITDPGKADCLIRCYLLSQAIDEVIDEIFDK